MATGTSTNVSAAKPSTSGAIHVGATTVTLPTSTTGTIPAGMASLGYLSEDGLTNAMTPTSEEIKAWGGDIVLTPMDEKTDTFKFTLIEVLNVDVLKQVFGASNVSGSLSTGISISANANDLPEQAYVIDMIMRNNVAKRICIPRAKISEIGEISYTDSDATGYEITITAMPDNSGNTHYEYIKAAATGSGG